MVVREEQPSSTIGEEQDCCQLHQEREDQQKV